MKKKCAQKALEMIENGMIVGLGMSLIHISEPTRQY